MELINLPLDSLIEIFSHTKEKYSVFRLLCKETSRAKISWDGWNSLIEQGYSVAITKSKTVWTKHGFFHSFFDLPAVEDFNYTDIYMDDLGAKLWYKNGILHRDEDLPAIIKNDGSKYWFKNGQVHRAGDLPAVIKKGALYWYKYNLAHRDKGPAVIKDGRERWFSYGKPYRGGREGTYSRDIVDQEIIDLQNMARSDIHHFRRA